MTLYLLHGALGSVSQLDPLVSQLRRMGYEPRAIEFAGHGDTPLTSHAFTVAGFATQVANRLIADDVPCADLFGYSMGGYVALVLARMQPHRVRRVVTLGTKFEWTPAVAAREVARLDPAAIRAKVPRFASELEARHRGAGGWERVLAYTGALLEDLGSHAPLDAEALPRIMQPVCIMVGDRDATVSVEESARVSRVLGEGQLAVLPGTPHPFEHVEQELLATLIARMTVSS